MKRILAVVGMAGSGKTVATEGAVEQGFTPVYFGGITMEELKKRKLEVTELNERNVREALREEHGMAAFAKLSIPKIDAIEGDVVIDGLYSWEEYKVLKEKYKDQLIVVAVYASPKTRYERLAIRPERPLKEEHAMARDLTEIENLDKGGPIAMADYTIISEGSIEQEKEDVKHVINKIKG
ncbi:MAG: AAA family ATPase [Nanoarchaeota archaeon]|nr:AAA family ATPase [Nanoarchaeota archaeon]